ncbi:MAG TPA: tRNA guanosine(34) transglycosylase Tgt [Chitinophagales bacterium]|nr:tRNA guanosine(34) transglycosylase Tgt [Chitinophagales bacterium]
MKFIITSKDTATQARSGIIETAYGSFTTPMFMPVGTAGSVKAVHLAELETEIHSEIILSNTYHLYLRPGLNIIRQAGGLHRFIGWNKPILTDSGGYQVYSLASKRKITEEGVRFQSHIDGSSHFFSPEYAIDIQRTIGADIIMAFDECTPYPCDYEYAKDSMELTHRWLKRCAERFKNTMGIYGYEQTLFPIVQGSVYGDLRKISAETIAEYHCEGNAIGGLSVGEPVESMYEMTQTVCAILPESKPRYLMGVGTPENLLETIALGIDLFDCVIPTRNGRNGMLFTKQGIISIRNKKWESDFSPIDADSPASVSRNHSKAYLRHLFVSGEILGLQIASINNLSLYIWLMKEAQRQIQSGTFEVWKNKMSKQLMQRL